MNNASFIKKHIFLNSHKGLIYNYGRMNTSIFISSR